MKICAKYVYPNHDGTLLEASQVLSPFIVYKCKTKFNRFVLMPKSNQDGMNDMFIFACLSGIRVCQGKGSPFALYSKVKSMLDSESEDLVQIKVSEMHPEIKDIVCSALAR